MSGFVCFDDQTRTIHEITRNARTKAASVRVCSWIAVERLCLIGGLMVRKDQFVPGGPKGRHEIATFVKDVVRRT